MLNGLILMGKIGMLKLFCGVLFFLFLSPAENFLKIESSIKPGRLSRAQEGKVVIKFVVKKGIFISTQPSFTIEFSPCEPLVFPKNFFSASDLGIEVLEKEGHSLLDLKDAVEIPFTVNTEAVRGRHLLEGKIKYFARSEEEGWCFKSSTDFSASFYTRSTTVKR
jgi:hypothetical protein